MSLSPRNIILLIGDGMGINQLYATQLVYDYLNMTSLFTVVGVSSTDALDNVVPDSAGAGTALATGFKTLNRMISMIEVDDKEISVPTILEIAKKLGMSTGLVTTTRITHATPAVFSAHVPHRDRESEIALQQVTVTEVDVMLGGGRRFYTREIIAEAIRRNYTVVFNRTSLLKIDTTSTRKLLGLFADSHIPYVLDRTSEIPSLLEMTIKAIEILEKNSCGFFLMIEGGRIDHAGHANDIASIVAETKEFDDVVGFIVSYAKSRKDTLVVVVADHETGGLAIGLGVEIPTTIKTVKNVNASLERIASMIRNNAKTSTEVKNIINKFTSISITDEEASTILSNPTAPTIGKILGKYFSVIWASTDHTAQPTLVFAHGPGSTMFSGFYHQTYIAKTIARLMLVGNNPVTAYSTTRNPTRGDINGNGVLDINDVIISLHFLGERVSENNKLIDMNLNKVIDLGDIYAIYIQIITK